MSAYELKRDHITRYTLFAIDGEVDLANLPTSKRLGSGDVITSTYVAQGSIAKGADGYTYMLNGSDEWIVYSGKSGGGNGGSGSLPGGIEFAEDGEIESLFGNDSGSGSGENESGDDGSYIDPDDLPDNPDYASDDDIESLFSH